MKELLIDLNHQLLAACDDLKSEQMAAYMKNKFEFLGIQAPLRRSIAKPLLTATKPMSGEEIVSLIHELWLKPHREFQLIGIDVLQKNVSKLTPTDIAHVEHWILTKSWWDTVDFLASRGVGHLFKDPSTKNQYLDKWLNSENIWLNRSCLLFQLFYRGKTDFELLKQIILHLNHKKEFFIQKAIGWSLRQYSKTNATNVIQFVEENNLKGLAQREALKWVNSH